MIRKVWVRAQASSSINDAGVNQSFITEGNYDTPAMLMTEINDILDTSMVTGEYSINGNDRGLLAQDALGNDILPPTILTDVSNINITCNFW